MGALIRWAVTPVLVALAACSPEADRVRDGGPGADPGNKSLVQWRGPEPTVADTTLWPGLNPAPVERLAAGSIPPPTYPYPEETPPKTGDRPVTPNVPPTEAQQKTFDRGGSADPQRPSRPER